MRAITRRAIAAGSISITDDFKFQSKADAVNCFGKNLKTLRQGGCSTGRGDLWLWFPDLDSNDWSNNLRDRGTVITERKNSSDADTYLQKQISDNKTHLVFLRKKIGYSTYYTYQGTFKLDIEESLKENLAVWIRISTCTETYGDA